GVARGVLWRAEPLRQAVELAAQRVPGARRIYLAADGRPADQARIAEFARLPGLILVSGRYEGVDERFVECCIDETVSVGDMVLSGGELPALMLVDAVARLLPGALGCAQSAEHESFTTGLLDW